MSSERWFLFLPLAGCLNLDSFAHNPVHCSTVGPDTCDLEASWDRVCTTCDEDYDWQQDYPWFDGQLAEGTTIRPIDPALVTNHTVITADGEAELDVVMIAAHGDAPDLTNTTILYNHGNYAGIEHYQPRIRALHEAGYTVIAWDYRGYGKSLPDSAPSVDQFLADSRQMRDEVEAWVPDTTRIVPYANSLGTIPAVEMALYLPGCALILEAPFINTARTARNNAMLSYKENFLSDGQFDNVAKIADVTAPLFVMIGTEDNKFFPRDAQALFDAAGTPAAAKELWFLDGVKHGIANIGVVEAGYDAYAARIQSFLEDKAPVCLGR